MALQAPMVHPRPQERHRVLRGSQKRELSPLRDRCDRHDRQAMVGENVILIYNDVEESPCTLSLWLSPCARS
jgi:hypothetical protein